MAENSMLVNFDTQKKDNQALSYCFSCFLMKCTVEYINLILVKGNMYWWTALLLTEVLCNTPLQILRVVLSCFWTCVLLWLVENNTMFYSYIDIEICFSFCWKRSWKPDLWYCDMYPYNWKSKINVKIWIILVVNYNIVADLVVHIRYMYWVSQ